MVVVTIDNMKKIGYKIRHYTNKDLEGFFKLDNEESKNMEKFVGLIDLKSKKKTNYAMKNDRKYFND